MRGWIVLILVIVAVFFAAYFAIVRFKASTLGRALQIATSAANYQPPPRRQLAMPSVLVGKPLSWRSLGSSLGLGRAQMAVGNFDADTDQEIMVRTGTGFTVVNLDDTSSTVALKSSGYGKWVAWDCDRDGIDDVVADDGQQVVVSALAGQQLFQTNWVFPSTVDAPVADFNGDGFKELVLAQPYTSRTNQPSEQLRVYGQAGALLWTWKQHYHPWHMRITDLNGDKAKELCVEGRGFSDLVVLDGQKTTNLNFDSALNGMYFDATGAGDWDGDGDDELIIDNQAIGILDVAGKTMLARLDYPQAYKDANIDNTFNPSLQCMDLLPAPGNELAVIPGISAQESALLIYAHPGQLAYEEEFGEEVQGLYAIRDAKGQHLLLETASRLLVYP